MGSRQRLAFSPGKLIVGILAGLGFAIVCLVVLFAVGAGPALDTDRDLEDFASPAEALAFTSAHLPVPLSAGTAVESLRYVRWADWVLDARVRLSTPEVTDQYLEAVRRDRKLNDSYCSDQEPSESARYFLADVYACCLARRVSPQAIEVHCNTR